MKVDVQIDQELLNQAEKLADKSAEETVQQALMELVKSHNETPVSLSVNQKVKSTIHP